MSPILHKVLICHHCERNSVIASQRKGLLILWSVLMLTIRKRNLSTSYVDYKKSLKLDTTRMAFRYPELTLSPLIVIFLMPNCRTKIKFQTPGGSNWDWQYKSWKRYISRRLITKRWPSIKVWRYKGNEKLKRCRRFQL